jgi:hypothetical protein
MRHGYGVRTSAPFGLASRFKPKSIRTSLTSLRSNEAGAAPTPDPAEKRNHRIDDSRGGFVLKAKSDEPPPRRNSLVEKTKKGLLSVRLRPGDHLLAVVNFLRHAGSQNPEATKYRRPRKTRNRLRQHTIDRFDSVLDEYGVIAVGNDKQVRVIRFVLGPQLLNFVCLPDRFTQIPMPVL